MLDLFFDLWMVHRPKEWMFRKRAVVISASAGASCNKAMAPIKDSFFNWGIPWVRTYGRALQASNWDMVKPENKEKVTRELTNLAQKIHTGAIPHVGCRTKFIFHMMKMMHEKGWDSSPVEKAHWLEKGWLGKERPWKW